MRMSARTRSLRFRLITLVFASVLPVVLFAVITPLRTSLWVVAGGGIAFLLLGAGLAVGFGKRIAGEIKSLSTAARAPGRAEPLATPRTATITDVEDMEREMAEAGRERAEAVAARLETEEALRESEERTRLIVSHVLDAVITIDGHGHITSWNPTAESSTTTCRMR